MVDGVFMLILTTTLFLSVEKDVVSKPSYRSLLESEVGPENNQLMEEFFVLVTECIDLVLLITGILLKVLQLFRDILEVLLGMWWLHLVGFEDTT